MADAPEPSNSPNPIAELQRRKIAGLPLTVWAMGAIVGVVAGVWIIRRRNGGSSSTTLTMPASTLAAESGSAGLGLDPRDPTISGQPLTSKPPGNNVEWGRLAVEALITAGFDPYTAQQVVEKYLNGIQLTVEEAGKISTAIKAVGVPPYPPTVAGPPVPPAPPPQPPAQPPDTQSNYENPWGGGGDGGIVSSAGDPESQGTWLVAANGAVFAVNGAKYYGAPNGKPYWGSRRARSIAARSDRHGYTITATTGETYHYPE